MDRQGVFDYVEREYGSFPEYLWENDVTSAVLRHGDNKKWYALIMNISKDRLGLADMHKADVLNVKCEPDAVGILHMTRGIFPAYHMNKRNWISILLDDSIDEALVLDLLDKSYELTLNKKKGKGDG